jgi:hypothetical protein
MAFFEYVQNNSGGSFVFDPDAGISVHVIVEAVNAEAADWKASTIGLYFDGYGDCPCCGDRWYSQADSWGSNNGDPEPRVDDKPISEAYTLGWSWTPDDTFPDVYVHYADGRIEGHVLPVRSYADAFGDN